MLAVLRHPLFIVGLIIRLALIIFVTPAPVAEWYVPFLQHSVTEWTVNPWELWLRDEGIIRSFPYGYAMWLYFLPFVLCASLLGISIVGAYWAALLVIDLCLMILLKNIYKGSMNLLFIAYWLSPIVIISSYLLGYNDLVPICFLALSLYCLRYKLWFYSGVALVAAISAKLSMALVVPFFIVYLIRNPGLHSIIMRFSGGVASGTLLLILPFVLLPSALVMLFSNPEMTTALRLHLPIGDYQIYLVPIVYLLMLYGAWNVKWVNFELFHATLGIALLLLVVLSPSSLGWFLWPITLLVGYQFIEKRVGVILIGLFGGLYAIRSIFAFFPDIVAYFPSIAFGSTQHLHQYALSIVNTTIAVFGIILSLRIWDIMVMRNDFFRLSRRPFVVGIAGDSGAGKDTYSRAIENIFGRQSITHLLGDNYHLWDRQKTMWRVLTHLNPRANNLQRMVADLRSIMQGKIVKTSYYDHRTGHMRTTHYLKKNHVILVNGLHALYLPSLRRHYDVKIYLDMDEHLRRYFKIARDVHERGHPIQKVTAAIEKRIPDAQNFIHPQKQYADLIFAIQPIRADDFVWSAPNSDGSNKLYRLVVSMRGHSGHSDLVRVLGGLLGLHVEVNVDSVFEQVIIEGAVSAEDIAMCVKELCPKMIDFLDINPIWADGVLGLMQLSTLVYINQSMEQRAL